MFTIFMGGLNHQNMGGVWHCFTLRNKPRRITCQAKAFLTDVHRLAVASATLASHLDRWLDRWWNHGKCIEISPRNMMWSHIIYHRICYVPYYIDVAISILSWHILCTIISPIIEYIIEYAMYIYESIFILVLTSEIVRIAGKQMDLTRKVCPASCVEISLMVPPTAQRWPQLGLSQKQGAEPADGPNPCGCRLKRTEMAPGPMDSKQKSWVLLSFPV